MLQPIDGITLDEQHIYRINNLVIPSVSEILRPASDIAYESIPEKTMRKAAGRGTDVHEDIQLYILTGMDDCVPDHRGYMDAFLMWVKDWDVEFLACEYMVYHKFMLYGGTIDLIVSIGGEIVVVDIKTTVKVQPMARLQVAGYAKALSTHSQNIRSTGILHLTPTGYSFDGPTVGVLAPDWDYFQAFWKVWRFKQDMKG